MKNSRNQRSARGRKRAFKPGGLPIAPAVNHGTLFLIALLGFLDAAYLARVHFTATRTCAAGDGCSAVLASPWAAIAGIPVAALGAGMYLALAWCALQTMRRPDTGPHHEPWMVGLSGAGVAVSAFLTVLQAVDIGQWCLFCLLSAALTTLFFLISLWIAAKSGSLKAAIRSPSTMTRGAPWVLSAFLLPPLIVLAAYGGEATAPTASTASGDRVVAVIGGETLTLADVDRAVQGKLQQLDEQRYRTRKAFLDAKLLSEEARRKGVTPETLIQKEIMEKIPVSQEEIRRFIMDNRSKLPANITPEVVQKIQKVIGQEKVPPARAAFLEQLKEKYGVRFTLPLPDRLTVADNPQGAPAEGPADAPVTLIVFSDFECPFCGKTHAELNGLLERFPGQVRLVFRHFPLEQHEWAGLAAEFAVCADRQGRFWPFADRVFAHRSTLSKDALFEHARQAGVGDMDAFNRCVRDDAAQKAVSDDIAVAKDLGVTSTPSLFVNGRFFAGMPPDIDAVIKEEIESRQTGTTP